MILGVIAPVVAQPTFSEKQITAIAVQLRDGGKDALMKYKPTAAQIEKIAATPEDAKVLTTYVDALFARIPAKGIAGEEGQTEVLVSRDLPGGYAKTSNHFKADVYIYSFKFVKPGETIGMSYDGLMNVDGNWVMIPKAWRPFFTGK